MDPVWCSILGSVVGIAVVLYVALLTFAPIIAMRDIRKPYDPAWFVETDLSGMHKTAMAYFSDQRPLLESLGFEPGRCLQADPDKERTHAFALVLLEPQSGDIAIVFANKQRMLKETYVEFRALYNDGAAIHTRNGRIRPDDPTFPPGKRVYWFPRIAETNALYAAHRTLTRGADQTQPRALPIEDALLAHFVADVKANYDHALDRGLVELDENTGCLRMTPKFALTMTWGRIWPMSAIANSRLRKRDTVLLERARTTRPQADEE